MVDFEWFRSFKAIYQHGTLTGAAQELLISQPNVSQHLSALEAHIGRPLFERQPRRMVPNEYGKLLYTQLIEAVERLEYVEAEFKYTRNSDIPLTCIGAPKEYFNSRLATRIGKASLNLIIEFGLTADLMQKMVKGQMSFVVATYKGDEKDMVYEPVLEEEFILVSDYKLDTSPFKKMLAKNEMDQAERWLSEQQWFAYSSNLAIIRRFWQVNFKKRPSLKPRFIIPDYDVILKAITTSGGITIASDYLVKERIRQKELKELWKGKAPTSNTIYLAYHKNNVTTKQVEAVRKLFK